MCSEIASWNLGFDGAIVAFQETLARSGLVVTVRYSRGLEGDAAGGQLRVRQRARG